MWPLVHHPRGRNDQPHSLTGCPDGPPNRNQFTPWTTETESRRETFTGVCSALEIGAAAPTSVLARRLLCPLAALQHRFAQSCVLMWHASPAAASCCLPDYCACTHRRQMTRATSTPFSRIADDAVAMIARACITDFFCLRSLASLSSSYVTAAVKHSCQSYDRRRPRAMVCAASLPSNAVPDKVCLEATGRSVAWPAARSLRGMVSCC